MAFTSGTELFLKGQYVGNAVRVTFGRFLNGVHFVRPVEFIILLRPMFKSQGFDPPHPLRSGLQVLLCVLFCCSSHASRKFCCSWYTSCNVLGDRGGLVPPGT